MSLIPAGPLDHVGIAVADLESACVRYAEMLGARVEHRERVEGQGVEIVYLEVPGQARIELIAPLGPDSPVARFLERRGEGLHHICFRVDDLEPLLERLQAAGVRVVDPVARAGARGSRIAFVHPSEFDGVLVELKEKAPTR